MTDSEYVPSEREVRADFVLARTRNFDSYMMGRTLASEQKHYGDEFDRWLDQVRSEAWDEAADHLEYRHSHAAAYELRLANPHRKEDD